MTNKSMPAGFPQGVKSVARSEFDAGLDTAGILNTGIIEHGPGALMTVPVETVGEDTVPSSLRYNPTTDEFEGGYKDNKWSALGGGGVRWVETVGSSPWQGVSARGYLIDTRLAAGVLILPTPKGIGDSVSFSDVYGYFDRNALTVQGGGEKIYGELTDISISTASVSGTFSYTGEDQGWVLTQAVGLGNGQVYGRSLLEREITEITEWVDVIYTSGMADVYVNGVRRLQKTYNDTVPGRIQFYPPLQIGDTLEVIEYTPIRLADNHTTVLVGQLEDKVNQLCKTPGDFGAIGDGVADDTSSFSAISTFNAINLSDKTYKVNSLSLTQKVVHSNNATIMLSGRQDSISLPLISTYLVGTLNIVGPTPLQVNVISGSVVTNSVFSVEYYASDIRNAKYQLVDIQLSGPVGIGSVLNISATQPELCGCFEVISVPATNVARVMMTAQGNLDLTTFTGTASVITTVLQYNNIRMIDISNGTLNLSNIAILGACYPILNGSRSNLYDPAGTKAGVTGIVARSGGVIKGTKVAVSGISGTQVSGVDAGTVDFTSCYISCGGRNGIAASNGKATFGNGVSSQNLLDNIISQDVSFVFAVGAKSVHAGRHGAIASNGSSLNITNGYSKFNGFLDPTNGGGVSAASSIVTAINSVLLGNSDAAIKAIGNSDIKATGLTATGNGRGVVADTNSHILLTGVVNSNTTIDLIASNGGKIEAISTTFTSSTPTANAIDGTYALIQTTSTIPNLETSGGLNIGGGGVLTKIVKAKITAVDFPSIPAGSQQSLTITVAGVLVGVNSVVIVNRNSIVNRAGLIYSAIVSANDTVIITANNFSTAAIDPPSENFNLVIIHF